MFATSTDVRVVLHISATNLELELSDDLPPRIIHFRTKTDIFSVIIL